MNKYYKIIKLAITFSIFICILIIDYTLLDHGLSITKLHLLYSTISFLTILLGAIISINLNKKLSFKLNKFLLIASVFLIVICIIPVTYWRINHPYTSAAAYNKIILMVLASSRMNLIMCFLTGVLVSRTITFKK